MTRFRPLSLLLLLLAPACGGSNPGPKPRLWNMAALQASGDLATRGYSSCDNPAGLDCSYFVSEGVGGDDVLHAKVSFSQGTPASYITTDFWENYDQIWVQPMYFLITSWNASDPDANVVGQTANGIPTGAIFSVGPGSAFYSPYWQVFYVELNGAPPEKYTSARQLFDDGLVMHPGPNRYASIGPDSMNIPSVADITSITPNFATYLNDPNDPTTIDAVANSAVKLTGFLDGAPVSYFDFGVDGFSADADGVVQDIPLFAFQQVPATGGKLQLLTVPYMQSVTIAPFVGGVAPLFSGLSGQVGSDNRPHFGGLWRLYFVTLPPGARAFDATDQTNLGLDHSTDVYINRVALNADQCLTAMDLFNSCIWLDSQAQIEKSIGPQGIERTVYEPACPFVAWKGAPVPNSL